MRDEYELVKGSWRNKPYMRRKPASRKTPSIHQLKTQANFAKAARSARGTKGFTEYKGKVIPRSAAKVGEALDGKKVAPAKPGPLPEKLKRFRVGLLEFVRTFGDTRIVNQVIIPNLLKESSENENRRDSETSKDSKLSVKWLKKR